MRATEFLSELMTSNVPYSVTKSNSYHFQAVADIGNRQIIYNAGYDMADDIWNIEFVERSATRASTVAKTGSGNELQVFSFVIAATKEFIERYHPEQITFTSYQRDENRSSLYKRLIKRFPAPGYKLADVTDDPRSHTDYFTLVKA